MTRDGKADVLVFNPDQETAYLAVQQADGSFREGGKAHLPSGTLFFEVADLDGDKQPDVAFLGDAGAQFAQVQEDGTLKLGPVPQGMPRVTSSRTTTFADFDDDGKVEILSFDDEWLSAFHLEASGAFSADVLTSSQVDFEFLSSGDFNGDGNPDLIAIAPGDYPQFRPLSTLYFGDGRGAIAGSKAYSFRINVGSFTVADFDGDRRMDFAYAGLGKTAHSSYVASTLYRGDAVNGLSSPQNLGITGSPYDTLIAADYDSDGPTDLAVSFLSGLEVFRSQGEARFPRIDQGIHFPLWGISSAMDVDGDGRPDLIGQDAGNVIVSRNVCDSTLPDLFVPAVISAAGVNGARYETELTIDNAGSVPVSLELTYVASTGGGGGTATITIPGRSHRVLRPAIEGLSALGIPIPATGDRTGALAIRVPPNTGVNNFAGKIAVAARVTTPARSGNAGVGFGGVPVGSGFSDEAIVGWVREMGRDRSNLALINLADEAGGDITLSPTVVSGPNSSLALPDVVLHPGQVVQIDRILRLAGASSGFVRVKRISGTAPFFVYGVVNDEGTSDGSFVAGFEPSRLSTRSFTVPAIVESDRYSTDLVITNTTSTPKTINFRFISETLTNDERTARFSLDVPANGQLFIQDLIQSLRDQRVDGIGPRGGEYAGALFAELSGETSSGIYIGARVSVPKPEGRYGVFFEAIPSWGLASRTVSIPAVRQDAEARTNVAVVNTGDKPMSFTLTAYDPNAGVKVGNPVPLTLQPGRWAQVNSILQATASGLASAAVYISPQPQGSLPSFLAYGVTNDGAFPGAGSDDGSYVPMLK